MSPDETALDLEWDTVLDRLEAATVAVADRGADEDGHAAPVTTDTWTPPVGLPPVPTHLVGRAEGVLALQRAALDRVEAERRAALGQLGALRAVGETAAPSRPVYLDASA